MNYTVSNISCLDLVETLDCGQAFRWQPLEDGSWQGVAFGKMQRVGFADGVLTFYDTTAEEYEKIWRKYFDIDRDYDGIEELLKSDETLHTMYTACRGVRVLNQEPWETLCSFIISQNNNIKRIKGIISRLCEAYGTPTGGGYAFPSAERIAALGVDDLAPLKCGFRAKYIIDAAQKVADGSINFDEIRQLDIDSAREKLKMIYGVGNKVADCTLLFGLGFADAFPKDVWINRAMEKLFPNGLPEQCRGVSGIVQQYIFSYARKTKLEI